MKISKALVRIANPEKEKLWDILFKRYPDEEWGTFIRMGWIETSEGLVLTLKSIDGPEDGDLNEETDITGIRSQYIRRATRLSKTHEFAVGFVHSHPDGCKTTPSESDDDMETYFSELFRGYGKPFISLIFSKDGKKLSAGGRVYFNGECIEVKKFCIEGEYASLYDFKTPNYLSSDALKRVARLASVFSVESAQLLAGATVGIVGQSGTGSPASELLCRAGVGKIIGVDGDVFTESNHERIHGSGIEDVDSNMPKVLIGKRHMKFINPDCDYIAVQGKIPQKEVIDRLLWCDIVIGATDLHSARVALSELSFRHLVPVVDIGVVMEGEDGAVSAQALQINRLFPSDPCVYCRNIIDSQIAAQELMSKDEISERQAEAEKAMEENRQPNAYWKDMPQLNTVGYLTTMAASIAVGYVIGYLTRRFSMAKDRSELSFTKKGMQVVEKSSKKNADCICSSAYGSSGQELYNIISTAPAHWETPILHE
jgi:molybdopterin/thiamine biosynthesis adenylyltransferase